MAAQTTLILHHPLLFLSSGGPNTAVSLPSLHRRRLPRFLSFTPLRKPSRSIISASVTPNRKISAIESTKSPNSCHDLLSGSTRTVSTLFSIAITASKIFGDGIVSQAVQSTEPMLSAAGPAFFAAMKEVSKGSLNTPLTVVAAGMVKWLDLYRGLLMVRVMLTWFPNIPWNKQPLSALRDLCDPYLNLFRSIIPPIFNALDVSPILAFAVLGTLGSILNSARLSF